MRLHIIRFFILLGLFFSALASAVTPTVPISDDRVFAYAEANYPSIFTGTAIEGQYQQYNYRYYPGSENYLAVDSSGVIFILGPYLTGNVISSVGSVNDYASPITDWEATHILKLDYPGFTIWLDCSKRGAVKFEYVAHYDTGNAARYNNFFLDPNVPAECQQTSSNTYGMNYDRGHLVPANHFDVSTEAIKSTNTMTNVLPQAANMNRGAWLLTEEIIECYRDIEDLLVIGGVIWGNDPADDYFVQSHGVKTPDAFWKVVVRGDGQAEEVIAWIVPNTQEAIRSSLDQYLVSVDELELTTGENIPVADFAKHDKPSQSWMIPLGCDKS